MAKICCLTFWRDRPDKPTQVSQCTARGPDIIIMQLPHARGHGIEEQVARSVARGAIDCGATDFLAFEPSDKCSRRRSTSLANSVRH